MSYHYDSYRFNTDAADVYSDTETNRPVTLANFGQGVGSGFPRMDYINGKWRVRLLAVRLAHRPGEDAQCWGEDLGRTLLAYVRLIKGSVVLTPRGEFHVPSDLVVN